MKRLALLITVFLLTSALLYAGLGLPGELDPVLAKSKFTWKKVKLDIEKRFDKEKLTVILTAFNDKGEKVWSSESLGEQEKFITFSGKKTSLAIKDMDSDGIPELVAAAMTGPETSALYIYKYQACCNEFLPMNFTYAELKFSRPFMVSDLYDPNNRDIIVMKNNNIRASGKIYTENDGPIEGYYFFEPKNGEFLCKYIKTKSELDKPKK